jgi:pimeloyl-ACP methyl ester carboxylesterase
MSEATNEMGRAAVDGLELEYELRGRGEPVVLIHWGLCAAGAEPLTDELALADHFRLLSYHRATPDYRAVRCERPERRGGANVALVPCMISERLGDFA